MSPMDRRQYERYCVIVALGRRCAWSTCPIDLENPDDRAFAQLDHFKGNGKEHRKAVGDVWRWAYRLIQQGRLDAVKAEVRLMCANHHQAHGPKGPIIAAPHLWNIPMFAPPSEWRARDPLPLFESQWQECERLTEAVREATDHLRDTLLACMDNDILADRLAPTGEKDGLFYKVCMTLMELILVLGYRDWTEFIERPQTPEEQEETYNQLLETQNLIEALGGETPQHGA